MAAKNVRYLFEHMALHNDERLTAFAQATTNAEEGAGPGEEAVVQRQEPCH